MYTSHPVLILEHDAYLAIDLSIALEELNGRVVGPARHVDEALAMLDAGEPIAAAIIDCPLPDQDVGELAGRLAEGGVPFVIHTLGCVPAPIGERHPDVPILHKPLQPRTVLARLMIEIRKMARMRKANPAA